MSSILLLVSFGICMFTHTYAQFVECLGDCTCPTAPIGTTCVLNCNTTKACSEHTLNCRPNDACIVHCTAKSACDLSTTINANLATDVTIICNEHHSCRDNINITCGTGDCLLECSNYETACTQFGTIDVSQSNSFHCIGSYCPINDTIPNSFTSSPTQPSLVPTNVPTNAPSPVVKTFTGIIANKDGKWTDDYKLYDDPYVWGWLMNRPTITDGTLHKYYGPWNNDGTQNYELSRTFNCLSAVQTDMFSVILRFSEIHSGTTTDDYITVQYARDTQPIAFEFMDGNGDFYYATDNQHRIEDAVLTNIDNTWFSSASSLTYRQRDVSANELYIIKVAVHMSQLSHYIGVYDISITCDAPIEPTQYPTYSPTFNPSNNPSKNPSNNPTKNPSSAPTKYPTYSPTFVPTNMPSIITSVSHSVSSISPTNQILRVQHDQEQLSLSSTISATRLINDDNGMITDQNNNGMNIGFDMSDYLIYAIIVCTLCVVIFLILCVYGWFTRRKIRSLQKQITEQRISKEIMAIPTTSPSTLTTSSNEAIAITTNISPVSPESNITDGLFPNTNANNNNKNNNNYPQMLLIQTNGAIETNQYEVNGEVNREVSERTALTNETENESDSEEISLMYDQDKNDMENNLKVTPQTPYIDGNENEKDEILNDILYENENAITICSINEGINDQIHQNINQPIYDGDIETMK